MTSTSSARRLLLGAACGGSGSGIVRRARRTTSPTRLHAHAGDVEALAERLDALEQDRERVLTLGNYGHEAWREANDARRRMLGDAVLATVFSELSAAELARVERTIRMLDQKT